MSTRTKRGLVIGGAALAIVGGGSAALAAGGDGLFGSNDRQAFLDDAAAKLNVSSSDLSNALQQAYDDRIDAAVKAGKLTQAQADELKARAKTAGGVPFLGPGGPGGRPGGHGFGPGFRGLAGPGSSATSAAAKYLGLTQAQLDTQLDSGKTLAQVAKAQNKTVAGLKQAMLVATKSDLDAAVKAGKLTQSQADSMLSDFSSRVDDVIQNSRPRFDGARGGPGGPRFQFRGRPGGSSGSSLPPSSLPPAA